MESLKLPAVDELDSPGMFGELNKESGWRG
jgi:hypothetical protein